MGAFINSHRNAESRKERLAIEKSIQEDNAKRIYDAGAPERQRIEQSREHEQRELRKDLILGYEGSDFANFSIYTGHLGDATPDQIAAAIQAAWQEFLSANECDQAAKILITEFLQHFPMADVTKAETFQNAHDYLVSRLCPAEAPVTPAVPDATPVTVSDRYESVRAEIADLRAKAEKCAFDSKERNDLERRAMVLETKLEVLGDSEYQKVIQTIVDQTGKYLSSAHNLQFRQWLSAQPQMRQFGVNPDSQNIRFAFAEWAGDSSFLNDEERSELQRQANVAGMTSEEVAQSVGRNRSYDPSGQGYRARRA